MPLLISSTFTAYASPQKIEVGTIAIPPYGINEQGESSGLYYELADLIVSNAGYECNNKIAPYARIVKSLKFGDTDLTIMFRQPELDNYVDYIAALPSKSLVVMGLQGQAFENISGLSGKKLVYLRGAKFNKLIDNNKAISKHLVKDFTLGIKMLVSGRADAIIGPLQSIQRAALELEIAGNKKITFGEPLIIETRTPWIQISKKSRAGIDIKKLRQSFLQLEEANTLNILQAKYNAY